jgi:hypothetical protein
MRGGVVRAHIRASVGSGVDGSTSVARRARALAAQARASAAGMLGRVGGLGRRRHGHRWRGRRQSGQRHSAGSSVAENLGSLSASTLLLARSP